MIRHDAEGTKNPACASTAVRVRALNDITSLLVFVPNIPDPSNPMHSVEGDLRRAQSTDVSLPHAPGADYQARCDGDTNPLVAGEGQ